MCGGVVWQCIRHTLDQLLGVGEGKLFKALSQDHSQAFRHHLGPCTGTVLLYLLVLSCGQLIYMHMPLAWVVSAAVQGNVTGYTLWCIKETEPRIQSSFLSCFFLPIFDNLVSETFVSNHIQPRVNYLTISCVPFEQVKLWSSFMRSDFFLGNICLVCMR